MIRGRELRQRIPDLRMVFCGSLGLHIVLGRLRETGHTGSPVNDLARFEVPPLDAESAKILARDLIAGERISCDDPEAVAESVAEAASRVPFYIQRLVMAMIGDARSSGTPEDARQLPQSLFTQAGSALSRAFA